MRETEHYDDAENPDKISSLLGLTYTLEVVGNNSHLTIPQHAVKKIGGKEKIALAYSNIFGKEANMVYAETEFYYFIQMTQDTPIEKVQALVDGIEKFVQ